MAADLKRESEKRVKKGDGTVSADMGTGGAGWGRAGKGGHAWKDQGLETQTLIKVEEKEVEYSVEKKRRKATGNKNKGESQVESLAMVVGLQRNGEPAT